MISNPNVTSLFHSKDFWLLFGYDFGTLLNIFTKREASKRSRRNIAGGPRHKIGRLWRDPSGIIGEPSNTLSI